MDSLGIFHSLQINNNNNVLTSVRNACNSTSDLVEKIGNYQNLNRRPQYSYKVSNKKTNSIIGKIGKNIMYNNNKNLKNNYKIKGKTPNIRNKDFYREKIFGIPSPQKYKNNDEVFNYNKEYENDLIDQIEKILHPSSEGNNGFGNLLMPMQYNDFYMMDMNKYSK